MLTVTSVAPGLGEYVRHRRQSLGMTLADLSAKCGLDHSYLSRIENGVHDNPTVKALGQLADGLRVKPETLYKIAAGIAIEPAEAEPDTISERAAMAPPDVQDAIKQFLALTDEQQEAALPSLQATLDLLQRRRRI
jgi:transcriptional regulator with XRE-family HTH domain